MLHPATLNTRLTYLDNAQAKTLGFLAFLTSKRATLLAHFYTSL